MSRLYIVTLAAALISSVGCSSDSKIFGFPGVYKINIQQGNVITQDMVDELRPGMTRRQVQFVMGTPLVADTFSPDRWDYIYSLQPGGGKRIQKRMSIYFENDVLSHFDGDYVPSEAKQDIPSEAQQDTSPEAQPD